MPSHFWPPRAPEKENPRLCFSKQNANMKTLILVLLAFVAATLAAENEVNFLFAGMIPPASSGSSGFTATLVTFLEVTNNHSLRFLCDLL